MYRKPGSTMTAVEVVSAMFDGPIPADVLMQARAEDSAYNADPRRVSADQATGNVRWNTRCARESIALIRKLIADGKTSAAEHERTWTLCAHLKARRQYQTQVRQIMQGAV